MAAEFKNRLKSLEAQAESISSSDADQYIEAFHKTLEEHMQAEEGHLKVILQQGKEQEMAALREEQQVIAHQYRP